MRVFKTLTNLSERLMAKLTGTGSGSEPKPPTKPLWMMTPKELDIYLTEMERNESA
jgi:hypothetical protein